MWLISRIVATTDGREMEQLEISQITYPEFSHQDPEI